MPNTPLAPPAAPAPNAQYDAVIEQLRIHCSRALRELALAAGRTVIEAFFNGDEQAYLDRNHYKASKFGDFIANRQDDLDSLGLHPNTLRHYVHAWIVWVTLPPEVQEAVGLSGLIELARVDDPQRRAAIAVQAHRNGWTIRELRAAIDAQVALDAPPVEPGTQLVRSVGAWSRQAARWEVDPTQLAGLPATDKAKVRLWIRGVRSKLREMEDAMREP